MNASSVVIFTEYNSLIPIFRLLTVLLLRAGSFLVQVGTFPTENIYNIIFQNFFDVAVSIISYIAIGSSLSFGRKDFNGVFGYGLILCSKDIDTDDVILGICASLVGSSIITQQLSGRLHATACFLTSFTYSGILLPLVMHWVWHPNGWMHYLNISGESNIFKDYAGGILIHSTAGIVGLIGSLLLGRRVLLLKEIDDSSVGIESPNTTLLGYILFLIGLNGLTLPKKCFTQRALNILFINNISTIGSSILTILMLQKIFCRHRLNFWSMLVCIQSVLAGMVVVSTGVNNYSLLMTMFLTVFGTVLFFLSTIVIRATSLEDYCNVTATHLIPGLVGSVFPQLTKMKQYGLTKSLKNALIQTAGVLIITSMFILYYMTLFVILSSCKLLRNKSDDKCYQRSENLRKNIDKTSFTNKLLERKSSLLLQPGDSAKFENPSLMNERSKVFNKDELDPSFKLKNKRSNESNVDVSGGDNRLLGKDMHKA